MPDTPLTEILKDFRSYRPGNHREFLEWVKNRASDIGVYQYALQDRASAGINHLVRELLRIMRLTCLHA